MELFLQQYLSASIEGTDLKSYLTRAELNRRQAVGKTRRKIKEEVFLGIVRDAVCVDNFDKGQGSWNAAATSRANHDYLRRLAPFILPDLAHRAVAFIVDENLVGQGFTDPDLSETTDASPCCPRADSALPDREHIYVEFPSGTVVRPGTLSVRSVVITAMGCRSKWSAYLVSESSNSGSIIVTWYVSNGVAEPFINVILTPALRPQADWNEICIGLTALVHDCLASRHSPASDMGGRSRHRRGKSNKVEVETVDVSEEFPGCRFRVERIRAHQIAGTSEAARTHDKTLSKHIVVPGFYKTVRYGKGRLLRRRQWIEDYHKGPRHLPIETKVSLTKLV